MKAYELLIELLAAEDDLKALTVSGFLEQMSDHEFDKIPSLRVSGETLEVLNSFCTVVSMMRGLDVWDIYVASASIFKIKPTTEK